jgi:hypothetical protein
MAGGVSLCRYWYPRDLIGIHVYMIIIQGVRKFGAKASPYESLGGEYHSETRGLLFSERLAGTETI